MDENDPVSLVVVIVWFVSTWALAKATRRQESICERTRQHSDQQHKSILFLRNFTSRSLVSAQSSCYVILLLLGQLLLSSSGCNNNHQHYLSLFHVDGCLGWQNSSGSHFVSHNAKSRLWKRLNLSFQFVIHQARSLAIVVSSNLVLTKWKANFE